MRAALKATQSVALSVQNRYARLGAERLHRTLARNLTDHVASAFRSWVDAGSRPEVARTNVSRSTVARADGVDTPRAKSGAANAPPANVISETREAATNTLDDAAEEAEGGRRAPTTPTPSAPSNAGAEQNGRHETTETGAIAENDGASAPVVSLSGNRSGSHQRSNPWSVQAIGAATPVTAPREKAENRDRDRGRDHVVGGFPFPVTTSSPADFIAPGAAASRPAAVTPRDTHARAASSDVSAPVPVAVARPDGSSGGPAANQDPSRVMLALREAVGDELYAVGERLLRCVEADHREIQGRAYRPIPVTGAERGQFHAFLQGATGGALRRAVLRFLRVQESYRAVAVESDRECAEHSREGMCVGHGLGGGGGGGGAGGGVRGTRRKSKHTHCVEERRHELSSLTTGPLSSPAEKARAARYEPKQDCANFLNCCRNVVLELNRALDDAPISTAWDLFLWKAVALVTDGSWSGSIRSNLLFYESMGNSASTFYHHATDLAKESSPIFNIPRVESRVRLLPLKLVPPPRLPLLASTAPSRIKRLVWASTYFRCTSLYLPTNKSRVLRDLTVPLLSDAEDAWARHRQPWPRAARTGGLGSSTHQRRRAPARAAGATKTTASARQREKACRRVASGDRSGRGLSPPASRRSPPCLDSGAGPRKFWEALAGPRLVDARWNLDVKVRGEVTVVVAL